MRSDIIQGKNINLAALLLPSPASPLQLNLPLSSHCSNTRLDWSITTLNYWFAISVVKKPWSVKSAARTDILLLFALKLFIEFRLTSLALCLHMQVDVKGCPNIEFNGIPLCNNFNESVCNYFRCKFSHVCSFCNDPHPKSVCPRRFRPSTRGTWHPQKKF